MRREVVRFRPPGITPLEIWNRRKGPRFLYEQVGADAVAALRSEGLDEAAIVDRLTPHLLEVIEEIGPEHVYLAGGLARLPWALPRTTICDDPQLHARHARALADVVVDVGQTSVKGYGMYTLITHRNRTQVPLTTIRTPLPDPDVGPSVFWIRRTIQAITPPRGTRLLLALPTQISDDLATGSCTFSGWEGDKTVIPGILTGLPYTHVRVVNDAELAAMAAPKLPRPTLVLTLGFAPGAALITTDAPSPA